MSDVISRALEKAGGISAVARARNLSDEAVRLWRARGSVPADHVLWLAERAEWDPRPHDLAPTLYPHPDDGMPPDLRGASARSRASRGSCRK
jgi:hypothetical protein